VAQQAQNDYKVSSTPTFFINNKMKQGDHDLESMSQVIDKALADTAKK
jgi:protein-disulfide isomerase